MWQWPFQKLQETALFRSEFLNIIGISESLGESLPHSVDWGIFRILPGLYPLNASSTLPPNLWLQKSKLLPDVARYLLGDEITSIWDVLIDLGMELHKCNLNMWEAEAGWWRVWDQPRLQSKTDSKEKGNENYGSVCCLFSWIQLQCSCVVTLTAEFIQ